VKRKRTHDTLKGRYSMLSPSGGRVSSLRSAWLALALPLDTWERHAIVADLSGRPRTVLDVGGAPRTLAAFMPGSAITTANVELPADAVIAGAELPFADAAFDAATSVDVLEHLDSHERGRHLEELARVARDRVVVCCPLGTPAHAESERRLAEWHEHITGRQHRYLAEHLVHGLPTEGELRTLVSVLPGSSTFRFHGDFRRSERLFRLAVLARVRPHKYVLHYVRLRVTARPDRTLYLHAHEFTNRAFIVVRP
jgi:SAM-dependent methyltransferase